MLQKYICRKEVFGVEMFYDAYRYGECEPEVSLHASLTEGSGIGFSCIIGMILRREGLRAKESKMSSLVTRESTHIEIL